MSDIFRLSATEIARALREKSMSAVDVTESFLGRLDQANPAINAVVQDNRDEAIAAAAAIDRRFQKAENPGALAGIPWTVKVNVDQTGHATTNGLTVQKANVATQDSPVVTNIRNAGGVIVGRTNTPAFSLRWFTKNNLHGQTFNPRNPGVTPGGSSGGAAAAVAAGLCAIGHGTDIAGSIRYPAYACGVHGLRPTLGRVAAYNPSGSDRFIGAQLMAVSGPIARTIDDIALALSPMSAPNVLDPWSLPIASSTKPFEKRVALTCAPDGMRVSEPIKKALVKAAAALEAEGWEVEEVACPPMRDAARINALLWMAETQFAQARLIEEEQDADAEFVYKMMCRDAGAVDLETVMTALQSRAALMRDWDIFLQKYPLFLCPTSGELPFEQQLDVRSEADFERVYEAQLTQRGLPVMGMPALSVATGTAGGMPLGVQLVAGKYREDILLSAGRVIEAASPKVTVADPA